MAELRVEGGDLVLHLTGLEKTLAVHGDLRAPVSALRGVEILENAHQPADLGFKIGERLPGVSEIGAVYGGGLKIFAAVHHDTPRGLRIRLEGTTYDQWIVGCADPEAVAATLPPPTG